MVMEVAILDVKPDLSHDFEAAFTQAQTIIASMAGYVSHQLQRCLETPNRYILLVKWQTLRGPHPRLSRLPRVPGMAPPAPPLLRPVS